MAASQDTSLIKIFLGVLLAVVAGGLIVAFVIDPLVFGTKADRDAADPQTLSAGNAIPLPRTRAAAANTPAPPPVSASPAKNVSDDQAVVDDFRHFAAAFAVELNRRAPHMTAIPPAGIDVVRTNSLVGPFEGRFTTTIALKRQQVIERFEVQFKFRWGNECWQLIGEPELFEGAEKHMSMEALTAAGFLLAYAKPAAKAAAQHRDD